MKDLKVVFMGTPSFGEASFKYLIEKTTVVLVVTQPDKVVGRKKEIKFSSIKTVAIENNIEVFQPAKIRVDYEEIKKYSPDLIITAAYGQIVPSEVLEIPKLGCINLHGSILPKYRGAAPIQWSLINGDKQTGVSLMYMDKSMDTGDVIDVVTVDILKTDNFESLYNKLSDASVLLLKNNLSSIALGNNKREKQNDDLATYARMLTREDEFIDFNQKAEDIFNKVRGVYPNAYINVFGEALKILECTYENKLIKNHSTVYEITKNSLSVCAVDGIINLIKVKPFGKKEMDIKSYLNGVDKNLLKNHIINSDK